MTNDDQRLNHTSLTAMLARFDGNDPDDRLWGSEDPAIAKDRPADLGTGLVSLAFIVAAIRRGVRYWCAAGAVGLLLGFGLYAAFPPAYQASTSLLLTYGPFENAATAINDAAAIAQSREVAGLAMHKLGLRQSVTSFVGGYTVAGLSERVLEITVNASSGNAAVNRANAIAAAFLQVRAGELKTQQALMLRSLQEQINQDRQQYNSIRQQIGQLSAQPSSPAQKASLRDLQSELSQLNIGLLNLEQGASGGVTSSGTALAVSGSQVLDAAVPLPHSRLKRLVLYPAAGLILGLLLGMGAVIVLALISDRPRSRADIARALGTPVKLSIGTVRLSRWLPSRAGLAAARNADVQRIVSRLHAEIPPKNRDASSLAVVPIGSPQVTAVCVASLAVTWAQQGRQVVMADLCGGLPAARLLGVRDPGVHEVRAGDARLVVAVPERDDAAPAGPRRPRNRRFRGVDRGPAQAQPSMTEALSAAYASADLLLTLVSLDPSLGGEHLATWASTAVAVVMAGKSSATRIHAAGEMVRLAGLRLAGAVLLASDEADESLGVTRAVRGEYAPDRV